MKEWKDINQENHIKNNKIVTVDSVDASLVVMDSFQIFTSEREGRSKSRLVISSDDKLIAFIVINEDDSIKVIFPSCKEYIISDDK